MKKKVVVLVLAALAISWIGCGCSGKTAGDVKMRFGNYEGAVQNFQEVLAQNPDDWETRRQLGIAYYNIGQYDQASAELTQVLNQHPEDPDALYYAGLARLREGRPQEALADWKKHHDPAHPAVQEAVNRQLTLLEISESIKLARKAIAEEKKLATTAPQPGSVAVFYYYDTTPEQQFRSLQKALAAMIITDLSQVRSLTVIERIRVQYLVEEMALARTDLVNTETAPKTGRLLGAENLVVGTLESGSIKSETSVASTVEKDVIATFPVAEEQDNFFKLQKQIVANILKALNVTPAPDEQRIIDKYHTRSFQAVVYYGEALDAQDMGNWKQAREYYRLALKEDPSFALAMWGYDSCPDDSAPSIGALANMQPAEFAAMAEKRVYDAQIQDTRSAEQGSKSSTTGDRDPGDQESAADRDGDVSVSW